MNLTTRCIPLGTLPYDSIESITRMEAKLFEKFPFVPLLPKMVSNDTLVNRTLENIPGVKIEDKKVILKTSSPQYKQGLKKLDKAFNHPKKENLEHFAINSPFIEKYLQMIEKFK